ncbi:uncharacterized protein [Solanum lycopersicum]|uniref:uncharacterized protein n=1 Tax=Solanum lycopersicum TaxID=4081 RepID=UPI003749F250
MTFPDILCVKNYKRLKNHFTSMSLFLTQIDISLIVLMASTERTPEEEVHITRPSWSKPEVKRLGKDDFFKENIKFRWVGRKCLLGIDNQGHCCCCWAFTSTEAITAAYALKNKREIVSLSKQQLIDCMYTKYKKPSYFADLGEKECFPCSYNKAYKFAMDYGITLETKYPFMEERGKCECQTEMRAIKINGFQRVYELIKELEEKAKEKRKS